MGNNKAVEKKRKKKGRPSLLDLQKRSLRLQKQQQQDQKNPNSNPYLRFPAPSSGRRVTRRNPNPDADDDDDDDDSSSNGKRREKKLKLVHRIPNSGSGSDGDGDREKGKRNNSSKGTDALQDSGPTTPLPDKKLLEFILDRLQKKDSYGVFSEPVDPEELPDYHEIIEQPMDFGTVRKKLLSGAYANLEQFEKDVFLISSNAMHYNAADTIYYRQARAIQELAKKNFENLRQESDDNEPEPKTVARRGRPPSKNFKQAIGRPSADRAASDFSSDATLANAGEGTHWSNLTYDLSRKGSASDRAGIGDGSARPSYNLCHTEPYSWASMHKSESNEEHSGYGLKGNSIKYGKKFAVLDENRRNTYKQPQPSACVREPSVLTAFDGERKQLVPIGLHIEHAYARSLARFAANLGPVGRAIAAKKIERVLPPGTKFGRGWIGESEAPQQSQPPLLSTSPPQPSSEQKISSSTTIPRGDKLPQRLESPSNDFPTEGHFSRTPPPDSVSIASNRSPDSVDVSTEPSRDSNHEGGSNVPSAGGGASNIQSKNPFQFHPNLGMQPTSNGYTNAFGLNLPSHVGKMVRPTRPPGFFGSDAPMMTHARALDMVSRSNINNSSFFHLDEERANVVSSSGVMNSGSPLPEPGHCQDSQGVRQSLSQQPKQDSVPPDLNVRFQSPGLPASGVMVDSQQRDLALQL